jgi:transcriptional regulator with XRE-family HTH domain
MTTNTPAAAGPAMSRQLLGTRLRQLREAHGLLLADATHRLGVAPSTLSRIETGRAPTRTLPVSTPSQFDLGWLAVD